MLDLWQWAVACVAAFTVGVSKTGVAGLGILAVAIFASVLPARESVGIVLPVLIAADIVAVTAYRRNVSWPHLLRLFPWAAVGIILGFLIMGHIDAQTTEQMIGVILIVLVVVQFIRRRKARPAPPDADARPHHAVAAITGVSAGVTTMVANAGGPIMIIYLIAMRLPKMVFMGTSAWYFFVLNLFKVPFNVQLGLINQDSLRVSAVLAPFAIAGALVGRILIEHIDQNLFEIIALVLTLIAAIRLALG